MGRLSEAMLGDRAALPTYPQAAGFKEGTTSRLAASQVHDVANVCCLVLQKVREAPRTADEVAAALDISILTVRPRMSELRAMNNVRPRLRADGKQERRKNESGASAIVWEAI